MLKDATLLYIILTAFIAFQTIATLYFVLRSSKRAKPLDLLRLRNIDLENLLQSEEFENEIRYNFILETALAGKIDETTEELTSLIEKGDSSIMDALADDRKRRISFLMPSLKRGGKHLADKLFQKMLGVVNGLIGLGSSQK